VIELRLPPLAARPADIALLARHFLGAGKTLGAAAETALLAHPWPGNVRELKNVMQRARLLAVGAQIGLADLGLPAAPGGAGAGMGALRSGTGAHGADGMADAEPDQATINAALARCGGVVAQAAAELGLSRQALYRRMERLGIGRP
jgi:DNA-binding NtrC family response regulator